MNTDQIKNIQRAMNQRGYTGIDGRPLIEDGVLGQNTVHAIRSFAVDHPDSGFAKADAQYNTDRQALVNLAGDKLVNKANRQYSADEIRAMQPENFGNNMAKIVSYGVASGLGVSAVAPAVPKIASIVSNIEAPSVLSNQRVSLGEVGKISGKLASILASLSGAGTNIAMSISRENERNNNIRIGYETKPASLDSLGIQYNRLDRSELIPNQQVSNNNEGNSTMSGLKRWGIPAAATVGTPVLIKIINTLSKPSVLGAIKSGWPSVGIAGAGLGIGGFINRRTPLEQIQDNPTKRGELTAEETQGGVVLREGNYVTNPIPVDSLHFGRSTDGNGIVVNVGGKWHHVNVAKLNPDRISQLNSLVPYTLTVKPKLTPPPVAPKNNDITTNTVSNSSKINPITGLPWR